ncbi:unnamed protein product [Rotaria sp. Silwood1]|nr:unnamed protein product [Rotaria sp. Silwood1]
MLKTGDTNQWDLTTLVQALRETKTTRQLDKINKQKISLENNALSKIITIRNNNAHHATKCILNTEFETIWSELSLILISFGGDADDIEKLKLISGESKYNEESIDEANTLEAKRLKELGNNAYKEKRFDEALKCFSLAIVLAGLSDYDRSILYSNRAATYLEKREVSEVKSSTDSRYLALQDAEHARDLRPTWSKAYYRIGQACMTLGDFKKAVYSFEKALALEPTSTEVKNARDCALEKKHYYDRQDHLDPRNTPKTTREQIDELSKKIGYTTEQQEQFIEMIRKMDPGKDAVFTGHQYRDGDTNVKQDYELAAKFYARAVHLGNAEGMYNLALLHTKGLGVKQDMQIAIQLLKQAAEQNPTMSDKYPVPNVGVAEAEHSLGLHYETGIGVEMDYYQAAQWYQRACDHGSATAANNLGLMYGIGKGVTRDLVKSEQLLRLSATRGDQNGAMNLALLFFGKNDFQAAEKWCQWASENNSTLAKERLHQFQDAAEQERRQFKELDVETWEIQNSLPINNMTYHQRIQRKMLTNHPDAARILSAQQDLQATVLSLKPVPQPFTKRSRRFDPEVLEEHSKKGSAYAQQLLEAQTHYLRAILILENSSIVNNEKDARFITEFSTSVRIAHFVIQIPKYLQNEIKLTIDRVLVRCNSQQSQLDEDARVCYGFLHMNSLVSTVQFLTVCIGIYPKSHFFLELRGSLYGFLEKYEQGLADINAALQLDPNNMTLLYDRAAMLRLNQHADQSETITAYNKFLKYAHKEHRKVPEAYYSIASCCLTSGSVESSIQLAEKYYEKGVEAEKQQLPCFLPYESNNKLLLSKLFELISKASDKSKTESVTDTKKPKSRLSDPRRIDIIRSHRRALAERRQLPPNMTLIPSTVKPRFHQSSPASLIGLKAITLHEMNPTKDHVYQGYVLSVIVFEQSPVAEPSIWLVIEDENGDLERLFIYSIPPSEGLHLIKDTYIYGTKMSILNPYMRMTADGKPGIRVDDFSSIILHGETHNVKNMCRCCGEANAPRVCEKCKSADYCSTECQQLDWKQYDHKLICT